MAQPTNTDRLSIVTNKETVLLRPVPPLSVVLAYQDNGHDLLGRSYLEHLFRELGWKDSPTVSEWKFEMLICQSLREVAAMEACGAGLILLAADSSDPLPEAVKEWVKCWCGAKSPPGAVLVVVLSECASCLGTDWPDFTYLEKMTKMCRRDVFVYAAGRCLEDGGGFCLAEAKQVVSMGQLVLGDLSKVARALSISETEAECARGDEEKGPEYYLHAP
jgi:hypothetical protein